MLHVCVCLVFSCAVQCHFALVADHNEAADLVVGGRRNRQSVVWAALGGEQMSTVPLAVYGRATSRIISR